MDIISHVYFTDEEQRLTGSDTFRIKVHKPSKFVVYLGQLNIRSNF